MPFWEGKSLENIIASAILGVLGAAISFFLSKSKDPWVKTKHFFGGILFGVALSFILNDFPNAANWYKYLLCFIGGAFVPALWPILERISINQAKNKLNPPSDDSH